MAREFITINDEEFLRELRKSIYDEVEKSQTEIQKAMILEAIQLFHERTPKKTGNAAFNWQTSLDNPIQNARFGSDLDGSIVISEAKEVLNKLKPYQTVWISNNCDYIEILEGGNSAQAPEGFFALTINELREKFDVKYSEE